MTHSAFVFPGQGSQTLGMLGDFNPQYPLITQTFAETSSAIGYDVWDLIQHGPMERLNQTEHTQVAMLTADVAIYRLLCLHGLTKPKMMAGHSLGEYAALVNAESITLEEGVRLVAQRGKLMQSTVPLGQGAMAAIVGLSNDVLQQLCNEASTPNNVVTPANYNAIGQTVVAGHTPAVKQLIHLAEEAGARLAMIIPVSVPCHCPLLKEAADLFENNLAQTHFKIPTVDVVSNVDLSIYSSPDQIRIKLREQLFSPVRWVETIQLFKQKGIQRVVECGPGRVLSGLVKRIDKELKAVSIYDTISVEQFLENA